MEKIIKEIVDRYIKENVLMEYFVNRSAFVKHVEALYKQIIENWCLIHYCTLIDRIETKIHWKRELFAHMGNIVDEGIKNNNSHQTRQKAIMDVFEKNNVFNHEVIYKLIIKKFQIEHINNKEIIAQVVNDCYESLNDIIDILSYYNDRYAVSKYIDTI